MGHLHRLVYRVSGGRLLGHVAGMPVLLLTTTGRRTGERRTTPLTYFHDGDDLVVIASNGGENRPPRWWLNLGADPRATVTIGGAERRMTARPATRDEHTRLWPVITDVHPGYAAYQRRTDRPIPVVILSPEPQG